MKKFICRSCGYVFSAENPEPDYTKLGTMIPDDYECPSCGESECKLVKDEQTEEQE